MLLICVPTSNGAIVNGDFEDFPIPNNGSIATSTLDGWSPTPAGNAIVIGRDPFWQNSNFTSIRSDGTQGGSVSALFLNGPDGPAPANSMASISQIITTVSGQFYDIRLWVANLSTDINGAGDPSARANLFSVMWGPTLINLSAPSVVGHEHFATPNPLNPTELAGNAGTYVLAADSAWTLVIIPNQIASSGSTTLTISAQNNNNATAVDGVDVTPEPSSIVLLVAGAAFASTRRRRQQRAA